MNSFYSYQQKTLVQRYCVDIIIHELYTKGWLRVGRSIDRNETSTFYIWSFRFVSIVLETKRRRPLSIRSIQIIETQMLSRFVSIDKFRLIGSKHWWRLTCHRDTGTSCIRNSVSLFLSAHMELRITIPVCAYGTADYYSCLYIRYCGSLFLSAHKELRVPIPMHKELRVAIPVSA